MDCGRVREKLIDLVYGGLPPEEDQALRRHCDHCPACAEELAGLVQALELTRQAPEPELPPFLDQRVIARVRERAERRPAGRWTWLFRPQVTMAAVAMIAASVVIVILAERGPFPPSRPALESVAQSADRLEAVAPPAGFADGNEDPGRLSAGAAIAADEETAPEEAPPAKPSTPAPPPREQTRERQSAPPAGSARSDAMAESDSAPAPAVAPAPVPPAPLAEGAAGSAPARQFAPAPARGPAGGLSFRAKSVVKEEEKSASALGANAPASAPAPSRSAESSTGLAPSEPAVIEAKGLLLGGEAMVELKDSEPSPSPDQLILSARELEKQGKFPAALRAYQSALAGLGYAPGNDKNPACSPALKAALEGSARCQTRLGKKAEAEAITASLQSLCPPK